MRGSVIQDGDGERARICTGEVPNITEMSHVEGQNIRVGCSDAQNAEDDAAIKS